ncbi:5-deoxy-glucuronate isomerase [Pseudothermotoga sp. U03pept]|uniref:5-deoxy-glucuronate isomerase n=1 Tax=Pseudothermotoga sp. U03pept TaxID=3447012 RepID=UPI003EFE2A07
MFLKIENVNHFISEPPANGMKYLGFERLVLPSGSSHTASSKDFEIFLVVLGGKCTVKARNKIFEKIGERRNVFSGKPYAVYLPPRTEFSIEALDFGCEVALTKAFIGESVDIEPYLIAPSQVNSGKWGISNYSRTFHQIAVDEKHPAVKLMVGETFTPSGNWSTYPPHRHEHHNPPEEVFLEEIYYYRVDHPKGWGLARHYSDDKSIDFAGVIRDDTLHLISKGYHTAVAAPGFMVYYLWFLAGEERVQMPYVDPEMRFVDQATKMIKNIEDNLSL